MSCQIFLTEEARPLTAYLSGDLRLWYTGACLNPLRVLMALITGICRGNCQAGVAYRSLGAQFGALSVHTLFCSFYPVLLGQFDLMPFHEGLPLLWIVLWAKHQSQLTDYPCSPSSHQAELHSSLVSQCYLSNNLAFQVRALIYLPYFGQCLVLFAISLLVLISDRLYLCVCATYACMHENCHYTQIIH